jgi:hypothetical protein
MSDRRSCTDGANVYALAAKAFEDRAVGWGGDVGIDYACEALEIVGGRHADCDRMKDVFSPCSENIAWLELEGRHEYDDVQRNFRILALCFMAAMVEAGDA